MPDLLTDPFMGEPIANRVGQAQMIEGLGSGETDNWANYSDEEIRNFITQAESNVIPTEATGFRARLEAEAKQRGITGDPLT